LFTLKKPEHVFEQTLLLIQIPITRQSLSQTQTGTVDFTYHKAIRIIQNNPE